ncbi:DUF6518 family protein [Dactylosporangium sp. CA-152071]|uniref:DUF6518 family protein n=1 Tax=Dactylosporangium sp. CA-152071 TaxID=3239933 RepID=UPI003D8EC97F
MNARLPVALGAGLGVAAYLPDLLDDSVAPYATPLFSSGFAWGLVALVAGYTTRRPRSSIVAGAAALTTAVFVYYLLVVAGQRWYVDASSSADGMATMAGLRSVGRSVVFWTAGALIGGGMLGWLGHVVRHAPASPGSAAIGVTFGLLSGEAIGIPLVYSSVWDAPLDPFSLAKLVPSLAQLVLGVATVAVLTRIRDRPTMWRLTVLAAAASVVVNVTLWYVLLTVRLSL